MTYLGDVVYASIVAHCLTHVRMHARTHVHACTHVHSQCARYLSIVMWFPGSASLSTYTAMSTLPYMKCTLSWCRWAWDRGGGYDGSRDVMVAGLV